MNVGRPKVKKPDRGGFAFLLHESFLSILRLVHRYSQGQNQQ